MTVKMANNIRKLIIQLNDMNVDIMQLKYQEDDIFDSMTFEEQDGNCGSSSEYISNCLNSAMINLDEAVENLDWALDMGPDY